MPLSEEELRMLEQMERALLEEDPKFASTLRGARMRSNARRRVVLASVVFVGGIALMMTGVVTRYPVVGIIGFLVMLGSATLGLTAFRSSANAPASPAATDDDPFTGLTMVDGGRRPRRQRRTSASSSGSFMERLEERWRRRRDNGGF